MSIIEVLYIILGACVVVITVTIVWLANETMKLVKSLRKSSDDVAFMTQEVKDKVLMVSEALDRAGTAATNIISLVEDAIEGIKEKRDQLADSIGLVTGVGEYFKNKKGERDEEKHASREERRIESEMVKEDKKTEKLVEEIADSPVKSEKKEVKVVEEPKENKNSDDSETTKPDKKEDTPKK